MGSTSHRRRASRQSGAHRPGQRGIRVHRGPAIHQLKGGSRRGGKELRLCPRGSGRRGRAAGTRLIGMRPGRRASPGPGQSRDRSHRGNPESPSLPPGNPGPVHGGYPGRRLKGRSRQDPQPHTVAISPLRPSQCCIGEQPNNPFLRVRLVFESRQPSFGCRSGPHVVGVFPLQHAPRRPGNNAER